MGLDDHVHFWGEVHDVPALMTRARLFVLPSLNEGLSLTLLEAMARGLPLVATRVGGLAEAIDDGTSGRLVPGRRPQLLADAVVDLAADPDERLRLSTGASAAAGRFSATRSSLEIEAVYARALAAALRSSGRAHRSR